MSAAPVQRLPPSRRLQPGYREERRKKIEAIVTKKMAAQKKSVSDTGPEMRSPLSERSNRDLQKKPAQAKPLEKKGAKPGNTENARPTAKRGGRTLSQAFLKTQTVKKKQTDSENIKPEPTKQESKPVLGAYRGKIIQSKITSIWKSSETKTLPEPNSTMPKSQVKRPQSSVPAKTKVRPQSSASVPAKTKVRPQSSASVPAKTKVRPQSSASVPAKTKVRPQSSASVPAKTKVRPPTNDTRPKRPVVPPASGIRPSSSLAKGKSELVTVRRTTQVVTQQRPIQQKPQPVKPPVKDGAVKKIPVTLSEKKTSGPAKTLPGPEKKPAAPQLPTASKFPRAKESAEERKARLAEWRKSKGIVMKRPAMATAAIPPTSNVQKKELEIKTEPEEPKEEETRQLYWATMAEEDEQELFTIKVRQIFGGCQKLIDEGCPREEVLSILEKQIQAVPEAKKLSGYWECLARLEKRDGQLYKVIAVCEEAVAADAQPLEELRDILADALEQLKPDPVTEESVKEEKVENIKSEEIKTEVKDETEEVAVKNKRRKRRRGKAKAVKIECPSTPDKPPRPDSTPENGGVSSSVIRFNIRTTPHLEKIKKLQMNEGESSVKSYKFLTPVRRSSRLEHNSHRLPDMLKDHDPCVSGIDQLGDLEEAETCTNAYIFRKNSALNEVTAKSATKN
ncbi:cytoskeleton-associated protein 2 [Dendropsophus ebraccatus]|uniref:cytoskeleton-associated protein 2 n=1 Tax=Dendropsophus ebraccatus TaxID=150705 RepID=UPI0038315A3E